MKNEFSSVYFPVNFIVFLLHDKEGIKGFNLI